MSCVNGEGDRSDSVIGMSGGEYVAESNGYISGELEVVSGGKGEVSCKSSGFCLIFASSSCRVEGCPSLWLGVACCCLLTGVDRSVCLVEGAMIKKPPRGGLQYDELVSRWREQTKTNKCAGVSTTLGLSKLERLADRRRGSTLNQYEVTEITGIPIRCYKHLSGARRGHVIPRGEIE